MQYQQHKPPTGKKTYRAHFSGDLTVTLDLDNYEDHDEDELLLVALDQAESDLRSILEHSADRWDCEVEEA